MWSDNTWGPESVSRLCLGGQRSPFSFRVIQMIPVSSWVRDFSFIIVVSTLLMAQSEKILNPHIFTFKIYTRPSFEQDKRGLPLLKRSWTTYLSLPLLSICVMQRLSQMTPALPSRKSSPAGSARPTPPLWGAACWPISVNRDMTSVALTSSPASGTSPGAAVPRHVLKVRQVGGRTLKVLTPWRTLSLGYVCKNSIVFKV